MTEMPAESVQNQESERDEAERQSSSASSPVDSWLQISPDVIMHLATAKPQFRDQVLALVQHRIEAIERERAARVATIRIGQVLAFTLALSFLGCATYLVLSGFEQAGMAMVGVNVVGLIVAFLGVVRGKAE